MSPQRAKTIFKERAPRLTGRIREEEATKRLGEVLIVENHRLLKPSTAASVGMTSTISGPHRQRQSGAPGVVSSPRPSARSRSASTVYFA